MDNVDPSHSRSTQLTQSRERLARALQHFERLVRDASQTITTLVTERQELRGRIEELQSLLDQEKANAEQRSRLHSSAMEEAKGQGAQIEQLRTQLEEAQQAHHQLEKQLAQSEESRVSLERDAASREAAIGERNSEIENVREQLAALEERSSRIASERDSMKSTLYEQERENAQWGLKLTVEEHVEALGALNKLLEQITRIEQNMQPSSNEKGSAAVEASIAEAPQKEIQEQASSPVETIGESSANDHVASGETNSETRDWEEEN